MAHRLSPEAETELDGIWYYIATQSGNIETADRFIDSLTDHFYLLARSPYIGRADFARGERQQESRSFVRFLEFPGLLV